MKKDVMIMGIMCILLGVGIAFMWNKQDRVAPTIIIPDGPGNYIEGRTDSLLEDVKAHDDVDGDVSSSLYVKVSMGEESGKAYATYYAKDNSNNVSKKTREIRVAEEIATEVTSGILLTEQAKEQESTPMPETTLQLEETLSPTEIGSPRITLTTEHIIVAKGTVINYLEYVENIVDDKDSRDMLYRNIQVSDKANVEMVGEYETIYYVVDSDENKSNEVKLTITVK